ncbi:MAG: hypothetical protein M3406_17285 [Chloroflexota bacterium]|nr:hypothetical protein [Chloroflexota bacterium]
MTFWSWRRSPGSPATQGSAALALAPELAPIEIYTADSRIVGWIAPQGQRITDLLTTQDELRLWRPSPGPLDDTDMPSTHTAAVPGDNGEWQSVLTSTVVLAMPPEWRASRQLRLHRRLRRAAVIAGPFNVTGNVHLHPGVEVGIHLVRNQAFVPLTDAYILHSGEPPFEHVVSVVIVNSAHVAQIVPLVSLA